MSAEPALTNPPGEPVAASAPETSAGATSIASEKPLINPLQTATPPPSSTIVEPPRSPNALNPAAAAQVTTQPEPPTSTQPEVSAPPNGANGVTEVSASVPTPPTTTDTAPVVTTTAAPADQPAQASPAPPAEPSAAAPAPIAEAAVEAPAPPAPVENQQPVDTAPPLDGAYPTPAGTTFDPIPATEPATAPPPAAAPATSTPAVNPNAMDVDADGEEDGGPNGAAVGVKRSGDDLVAGDAKRVNLGESGVTPSAQAPVLEAAPGDPNAPPVVYPWTTYVEPAPRNPGPTTPLTQGQHKHLLSTVRSLLKSNNSFNFREPVDVVRFNIPHYSQIIDYPMDLGLIETKLIASDPRGPPKDKSKAAKWDPSKGTYASVSQVTKDVRQIWENTRKFNGRDHVVSQAAGKLDDQWEKALRTLPADLPPPPPAASASPAGPSTTPSRRQSISQTPTIRRDADSARPKREIHPPPSKDLGYEPGSQRKPKRRNDPQLQWAQRTITSFEKSQKYFEIVSPFLYPVSEIISAIPVYKEIIKKPIDLLLIKARLEDNIYEDASQVDSDIRLLVSNATTFNPPGDSVHNSANALLQLWEEKYRTMPPKQEPREPSEDVILEEEESDTEDKDTVRLKEAKAERAALDREIADLEAKIARRPPKTKRKAPAKPAKAQRKYSTTSKASPGANGHSAPKKPRKQKEAPAYREDADSEEELQSITIMQKQELAEKIQVAEADILSQAVQIIQASTQISGDQEIELDIDSLPNATVLKLYNLVCRGRKGRGKKNKVQPRKSGFGGAPGRKHLNEQEEADRIAKMEAQLQSFEGRGSAAHAGYDEESSSEEESSDEE